MAKRNDAPALITSLLLTLALLLAGGWWLMRQLSDRGVWTGLPDVPTGNVTSLPTASGKDLRIAGDRLSLGGIQLLAEESDLVKARAIAQAPTPVTREGIQQALAAADFAVEGATGTVSFLPSGDRNQTMQLVVVEPGTRSGYGYDFVPVE